MDPFCARKAGVFSFLHPSSGIDYPQAGAADDPEHEQPGQYTGRAAIPPAACVFPVPDALEYTWKFPWASWKTNGWPRQSPQRQAFPAAYGIALSGGRGMLPRLPRMKKTGVLQCCADGVCNLFQGAALFQMLFKHIARFHNGKLRHLMPDPTPK